VKRALLLLALSALGFVALFALLPRLDMAVSGWFYDAQRGFAANDSALVRGIYDAVLWGSRGLLFALAGAFVAACAARGALAVQRRVQLGFLALAFFLGPGLIVDVALKDHWGRARPSQVQEFGGTQRYSPPLVISDQCANNCSFVSGHASAGFALLAFGLLAQGKARRRWVLAGIAVGLVAGAVRIMQGGHFLSDVIFSFYFTTAGVLLAAALFHLLRWPLAAPPAATAAP
jgi:lipid A 4'-phosphatase